MEAVSGPHLPPQGTNYQKTNPLLEILRSKRSSFWAQAEVRGACLAAQGWAALHAWGSDTMLFSLQWEEDQRCEEERRRAQEAQRRWEHQRMEEECREASERERRVREKEQLIREQRWAGACLPPVWTAARPLPRPMGLPSGPAGCCGFQMRCPVPATHLPGSVRGIMCKP